MKIVTVNLRTGHASWAVWKNRKFFSDHILSEAGPNFSMTDEATLDAFMRNDDTMLFPFKSMVDLPTSVGS